MLAGRKARAAAYPAPANCDSLARAADSSPGGVSKLAAILAADVVGYSALMERDEKGTHESLKTGRKQLVFGRRLHGRSLGSGREHGATISADGAQAISWGDWLNGEGSARIEGNKLCLVWSSNTYCSEVLRHPRGTRAAENEYIWFDGWAYPFSPVQ